MPGRQGFASPSHHHNVNELAAFLRRGCRIDARIPSNINSNKLLLKINMQKMGDNPLRVALLLLFLLYTSITVNCHKRFLVEAVLIFF